ncbi:MAG: murein biosynthesis integral membrane protein MurJ [Acidobacteria bacterium]|nr:murein biosynthesis integral membrane protein MurJ [Acidobacteriota bacterium]
MSHSSIQIAKSAGIISVATMLSRILGLVREQLIATLFSRTATDAFYVAFRIPNLLRDLFAEGAMSSAFVPTFTEYLKKREPKDAWRLASNVVNLLLVTLSLITILGILFSEALVSKFAGDFKATPGKFELTVLLTQVMFPFLPLVALAAAVMGILNSRGSFFIPALAPALFNVGSIVVASAVYIWLPQWGYDPILGMAIGTLCGGALQLLVQLPPLFKQGFVYSAGLSLRHPGVQRILLLMGPGTLGLASTQINIFVNTWLATSQGEGPVSWLNYAFRLMQFPLGIFGVAIASAALPTVSAHVATQEFDGLRRTLSSALRMVLIVNIPATLGLIFLSRPIIALIYQHGKFKEADTHSTANALIFYSIGLFAYSGIKVLVPAFYALGRSKVPVIISAISVGVNIGLNLWLIGPLGYLGLALGTSLTSIGNFLLLLQQLQRYSGSIAPREIFITWIKMLVASAIMGAVSFKLHSFLSPSGTAPGLAIQVLTLGLSISLGLVTLYGVCLLLRIEEIEMARGLAKRKLRKLLGKT